MNGDLQFAAAIEVALRDLQMRGELSALEAAVADVEFCLAAGNQQAGADIIELKGAEHGFVRREPHIQVKTLQRIAVEQCVDGSIGGQPHGKCRQERIEVHLVEGERAGNLRLACRRIAQIHDAGCGRVVDLEVQIIEAQAIWDRGNVGIEGDVLQRICRRQMFPAPGQERRHIRHAEIQISGQLGENCEMLVAPV